MRYLTVAEVAEILRIRDYTVREYLRNGELRGYKIGDVWRVAEEDLKEFLERRANRPRKDNE